jgi:hypothetical protein
MLYHLTKLPLYCRYTDNSTISITVYAGLGHHILSRLVTCHSCNGDGGGQDVGDKEMADGEQLVLEGVIEIQKRHFIHKMEPYTSQEVGSEPTYQVANPGTT